MRHPSFLKLSRLLLLVLPVLLAVSCKKDDGDQKEDLATVKQNLLIGTWKQKDVQLAYSIKFAGQTLPVGYSFYNITSYLPLSGPLLECTKNNVYTFDANGTYSISGCTDLILPNAGSSGSWNMQIYGSALHLVSTSDKDTPLWIQSISDTEMTIGSLSFTIYIAEAGASIPAYLVFEKQ